MFVGGDPEVFLIDGSGKIVSAIERIPGTKHAPHKTRHGAIHHDNVLAEINFKPARTASEFIKNVRGVLVDLQEYLDKVGCGISIISSYVMPDEEVAHPLAQQFGCEGDFDAWGLDEVVAPDAGVVGNLRTAGGHIHIGYDVSVYGPDKIARACDVQIGLATVLLDNDTQRRQMYGAAGRYRPKPYGSEYRVPSNFWLKSDEHMTWVFESAAKVLRDIEKYDDMFKSATDVHELKYTINSGDRNLAVALADKYKVEIPWTLVPN
jgi:hypothetical protein